MITIWKYPVRSGVTSLTLPYGSHVLDVQVQDGQPVMWVQVDTDQHNVTRKFVVYGTGHPMPAVTRQHIGTFQLSGYVFHLFEEW